MLAQFSGINFSEGENINKFDYWADKFENLPMYFMRFFGSTSKLRFILTNLQVCLRTHR